LFYFARFWFVGTGRVQYYLYKINWPACVFICALFDSNIYPLGNHGGSIGQRADTHEAHLR